MRVVNTDHNQFAIVYFRKVQRKTGAFLKIGPFTVGPSSRPWGPTLIQPPRSFRVQERSSPVQLRCPGPGWGAVQGGRPFCRPMRKGSEALFIMSQQCL